MKHISNDNWLIRVYDEDRLVKNIAHDFSLAKVGMDGYLYLIEKDTLVKMDMETESICWSKSFDGYFLQMLFSMDGSVLLFCSDAEAHTIHWRLDAEGQTLFHTRFEVTHQFFLCVGNGYLCGHHDDMTPIVQLHTLSNGSVIPHPHLPTMEDRMFETCGNYLVTVQDDALIMYEYQNGTFKILWDVGTRDDLTVELKFSHQGDKIFRIVHLLRCEILSVRDGQCLFRMEYNPIGFSYKARFSEHGNFILAFKGTLEWKRYPIGGIQKIQSLFYRGHGVRSLKRCLDLKF